MTRRTRTTDRPDPQLQLIIDAVEESGLTQAAIARRMGLPQSGVSDRLRGRTRFTARELPVLAQVLGTSVTNLLEDRTTSR